MEEGKVNVESSKVIPYASCPFLHVPRYIIPRFITLYILGYFYFNSPIDTVAELCTVVEVIWADKVKKKQLHVSFATYAEY